MYLKPRGINDAFPNAIYSVSREFLDALNNGEYDDLIQGILNGDREKGSKITKLKESLANIKTDLDFYSENIKRAEIEIECIKNKEIKLKEKLKELEVEI